MQNCEQTFRARAAAMGLAVWDVSADGALLGSPTAALHGPMLAAWLNTPTIRDAVAAAAAAWPQGAPEEPIELFPGGWLLPIVRMDRRRARGWYASLALGAAANAAPMAHTAAGEARLTPQELMTALAPAQNYTIEAVRQLQRALVWIQQDLTSTVEQRQDIDGLTTHLTDSYETMDTLYAIARAMSSVTQPRAFVTSVCARLIETMQFDLVAVSFADDPKVVPVLRGWRSHASTTDAANRAAATDLQTFHHLHTWRIVERPAFPLQALATADQPQALVVPLLREGAAVGCLLAALKRRPDTHVSSHDIKLLEAVAGYVNAFLDNAALYSEQKELFFGTLQALTAAIDAKDRYTRGHSERVAHLAQQLARATGMSEEQAERVRIAGLVHDVGKIGVPEAVLCKQGRLTDPEFDLIKLHPQIGHHILEGIPALADVLPGVLHHHERPDGRGYPSGLSGEEIPRVARIIALADTFDAMSSTRSYRAALPRAKVLAEIERCAGIQFDEMLAKVFLTLDLAAYDEMVARHAAAAVPARAESDGESSASARAA